MFRLLSLLVVTACAARQPSAPPRSGINWPDALDHASTPATHREAALLVLDSTGTETAMAAMIDVSLAAQLEQNPILKPYEHVMREFFAKYLSYASLRDDLAQALVERFDELQLRQIGAFYTTPTGKIAITKLRELVQIGAQIGRERVAKHQGELVKMIEKAAREQTPP